MKFTLDETNTVLKLENVQLEDRSNSKLKTTGTLHLTDTHLVFIETNTKREIWIYFSLISSIEKLPLTINGSPILIRTKHFLNCLFVIPKERDCQTLNLTLSQYSRPTKYHELLCFKENNHLKLLMKSTLKGNQQIFNLQSEYARMGLPSNKWTSTDLNADYELCDTYPDILFVPASVNVDTIRLSANFRSRGRLPALSYLHPNGASITRCSQPLTGFNGRCVEDEQMLQHILMTNESSKFMYVVDTRPKINAMANKAQGKGYENEANYKNIQFYFIGIENIHVMRSSLEKLVKCADNASTSSFYTELEKSDWLKHIKAVIDTSVFIMEAINDQNVSVLVHCSDGWDRTAQTCALASLMLDPYYRSIHGFQVLIEKEWLMFGHKFSHRCGHIYENDKEISPIFTQFLECTWQLQQQFPCAFEFNETYLVKILEHVYSCQFGTFVGNCQKERVQMKLNELTYSLWDYIQYKINDYINPLYIPNSSYSRKVLRPDTRIFSLKFWRSLYNRFDANINPTEKISDTLSMLNNNTAYMLEYAKLLEKRCSQLRALIEKNETEKNADLEDSLNKVNLEQEENVETKPVESASPPKLKSVDSSVFLTLDKLSTDYNSIELNWKSSRKNCNCFEPFDFASSKLNCVRCGEIYCERCVENGKYVTSQVSTKLIFACETCVKQFDI